jgi:hypothetical protein
VRTSLGIEVTKSRTQEREVSRNTK